jgi:hypothetical protein
MAEPVKIPISFFEVAADYERPDLKLWADRAVIVQGIFDALRPWDIGIDDVEPHNTGKPSEQGVTFKLPLKRVAFFFGAASCRFTRDDADWNSAEETATILDTALAALMRLGGVQIAMKKTAISMHIQPRALSFIDILRPFLPAQLAALETEPVMTMAAVAKWDNRKVTIDGSATLANGLFVRLERDFPGASTYQEIALQLRKDEEALFKILGVEEDQG